MSVYNKDDIIRILRDDLKRVLSTSIQYKYTPFNTGIDKILCRQTLRFSDPSEYNDPFDCNENLLKLEIDQKYLKETIKNSSQKLSRVQRRKIQRDFGYNPSFNEILKKERKKFKLHCFSEICNDVLMWSYYAEGHNGMCIGFNFPYSYDEKFILCSIKYIKSIISLDGEAQYLRTILYWLTTKSHHFKHEKEIRAITRTLCSEVTEDIFFERKYVKEIIFGNKVSQNQISETINKLQNSDYNLNEINFSQCTIDFDTFSIKTKSINPYNYI